MRVLFSVLAFLSLLASPSAIQSTRQIVRAGADLKLPFSPAVKAGKFIYLSGALATDETGRFASGDIQAQTRRVLDNLARVLKAAGSRLENAASVNVYLRSAADFPAMNEVYKGYWPKDPPARTTVMANLAMPEALIEMSMIAVPDGAERQVVHPSGWVKSPNPYSYGIRSGDTMYLAGLLARRGKDNAFVAGDIKIQTQTVMDNAGEILKAGGMTLADVAGTRVYITDTALFQDMNAAYRTYFPRNPPARATVRTTLMSPEAMVEISLVAVTGGVRDALNPPNADGSPAQPNPNLSSAIRIGNRLFLSGMLGNDASNKGDAAGQTRATLARIARTLKAAGFDWPDVVDATVYLTDMKNMNAMNEAYREVFKADPPARVTAGTGLVSPDALVEIMVTASK
ncbi:MAG: RidA family protein [Acidobacteriia bacterium]|nr:RidA family protein [Terriglobia bacterium]